MLKNGRKIENKMKDILITSVNTLINNINLLRHNFYLEFGMINILQIKVTFNNLFIMQFNKSLANKFIRLDPISNTTPSSKLFYN